jgi:hypothetical protein
MSKRSLVDRFVYKITSKPKHCVKVKNPPKTAFEKLSRPQDARQEQYNEWSRHFKVYSGSYLPKDDNKLLKKGWSNRMGKIFQRKSTGQTVRSEQHVETPKHYHWLNLWKKGFTKGEHRKFKEKEFSGEKVYYDEYGRLVSRRDPAHHIYGEENYD